MKKIFAVLVAFTLAAGTAFAVDIGGTVIGSANIIEGSSEKDSDVNANMTMNLLRLDGYGEADEGVYGGYIRLEGGEPGLSGYAFWKPISQFRLIIGQNGDGFWGKDGVVGWMFQQKAYDTSITDPNSIWYPKGYYYPMETIMYEDGFKYRNAFYGGFDGLGVLFEIKPIELFGINIAIPYSIGGTAEDVYSKIVAQLDFNLKFGNIAVTFESGKGYKKASDDYKEEWVPIKITNSSGDEYDSPYEYEKKVTGTGEVKDPAKFFAYFGLTAIKNLGIDIGIGYTLPIKDENKTKYNYPVNVGIGLKFTPLDAFGIKFRTVLGFGGSMESEIGSVKYKINDPFLIRADILPYFTFNDKTRVFLSTGFGLIGENKYDIGGIKIKNDAVFGWHVNPYLEIGSEWGATFYAGFKLYSDGVKNADDKTTVNWAIPIAVNVSF